jgi:hypothetical protein
VLHLVENSLLKRLWICRKTDCVINDWIREYKVELEQSTKGIGGILFLLTLTLTLRSHITCVIRLGSIEKYLSVYFYADFRPIVGQKIDAFKRCFRASSDFC